MSIIPIGYMAGTYRTVDAGLQSYVRTGRRIETISPADLEIWALAHDQSAPMPTDDDARAARQRLLRAGLLVEVNETSDDSGPAIGRRAFADEYCFRGLLGGLGQSSDDPGLELVGMPTSVVSVLPQSLYGLWLLAGQAPTLTVAAEQIITEASTLGDVVSIDECLLRLLPDLTQLVERGLGYFDAVPQPGPPLRYLTFEHVSMDTTMIEELRTMSQQRLLTEGQYRSQLSRAPEGLLYLVEDPKTGQDVGYAGFAAGALFDTIASMNGRTPQSVADQARRQLSAAGKFPLLWHVQQADDVDNVRQILTDAGISGIEVRHTPPA